MAFDLNAVLGAVKDTLLAKPELGDLKIERAEVRNKDIDKVPWCGLYMGVGQYAPLTIAAGTRPWQVTPSVRVILQEGSYNSGVEAEGKVLVLFRRFMEAIEGNLTLKNAEGTATARLVRQIDFELEYDEAETDGEKQVYFVAMVVDLSMEGRA